MNCKLRTVLIAVAAVLSGCGGSPPRVPPRLQGDIPIVIANETADPICMVMMFPMSYSSPDLHNWLGSGRAMQPIAPGERQEFTILPDAYRFSAASSPRCDMRRDATWIATTGTEGSIEVRGPTYIAVGAAGATPPGYEVVSLAPSAPGDLGVAPSAGGSAPSGAYGLPSLLTSGDDCRGVVDQSPAICDSDDCRAIASGNSAICDSNDCRGVVDHDPAACDSNDCRAVASGDSAACDSDDCRGVVDHNSAICDSATCRAIADGSSALCP